jgi:hypothetical protein
MWDQLILCYRLLDKKQVAQELVLQRLQVGAACRTACRTGCNQQLRGWHLRQLVSAVVEW